MTTRHGGQILTDQLAVEGVRRVFSVPGESFLAVLDGLYDSDIDNVVCRHEGGAAMMAEAHGKLTGQPGIAFVTRGPGATNASSGVHVAMQDSTPMILFVGQVARGHRDREAFQEVDYRAMFGSIAKWVTEIDQTERIPELVSRAFQTAMSGRPGPVVVALPEDMLSATSQAQARPKSSVEAPAAARNDAEQIAGLLSQAKRPLLIVGGPGWSNEASETLSEVASRFDLPVAVPFRRQDYLDNTHPNYVGDLAVGMNPELAKLTEEADTIVMLGTRMGDIATDGYRLLDPLGHSKTLVQTHPDPSMLGRLYATNLGICASSLSVLRELIKIQPPKSIPWTEWRSQARDAYERWQTPKKTPGNVHLEDIVPWLSENLPENAILTNGAGNYAAFLHRYFSYKRYHTQLAPTSGSMGYGFPAAIAAKLEHPDRPVVCFAGDGCFQMTLNECSTAIQHGAAVIVIVANNGKYGTIRMHQEGTYPGRVSGTALSNPDFAALARAYGGFGVVVERTEDFAEAFTTASSSGSLAVIELRLDDEVLSTGLSLRETRVLGERSRR